MTSDAHLGADPARSGDSATYKALRDAIPGLDGMYRLVGALIADRAGDGRRLLIVGAGGGREIEECGKIEGPLDITAIDPSEKNLERARLVLKGLRTSHRVAFLRGQTTDLPLRPTFDMATSLLVMHGLQDDVAKLRYLSSIRSRLSRNALFVHADICFDHAHDFEKQVPTFLSHARFMNIDQRAVDFELETTARLSIASPSRIDALFAEADFTAPYEVFRSLWYRCWICTPAGR